MKRFIFTALISLFFSFVLLPKGTLDEDFEEATGIQNWDHTYDISEMKPGKYNLIIRGTDNAGNTAYEGPYNIYIDPASDFPIVSITNPLPDMRVGGNLNIIGICTDDDAVQKVLVKLDDGPFFTADGTEYWSYYLDTAVIPDGTHTISAVGVDENGTEGNPVSVSFKLDQVKPVIKITSHASGDLVSKVVVLEGSVADANGIESLLISEDGGETYTPLGYSYKKGEDIYSFSYKIDTRKRPDGPQIFWFRTQNKTESSSEMAFLLFIDNTAAEITVDEPVPGEKVNGPVRFSGTVSDTIGVTALSYTVKGEDPVDIPIQPGNPYWTTDIDLTPYTGKQTVITFTVTDVADNVRDFPVKYPVDAAMDIPVLTIVSPVEGAVYTDKVILSGYLRDDDSVKTVAYILNKGDEMAFPVSEAFETVLENLQSGKNQLSVTGIDSNGTRSKPFLISFTKVLEAPVISMEEFATKTETVPFVPGMEIAPDSGGTLSGKITAANALLSAEWILGDSHTGIVKFPKNAKQADVKVSLPADVPYGIVPVTVKSVDIYEQETIFNSFIYVTNYSVINEEPGIYFFDPRIGSEKIALSRQDEFVDAYFIGGTIAETRMEPQSEFVRLEFRGQHLYLRPVKDGLTEPFTVTVITDRDHVFQTEAIQVLVDLTEPVLTLTTPKTGDTAGSTAALEGNVDEPNSLTGNRYSLDGGATAAPIGNNTTIESTIPLTGDEIIKTLTVTTEDAAGKTASVNRTIVKDTKDPEIRIIFPQPDSPVSGTIVVAGAVFDDTRVDKLEWSADGETYTTLQYTPYFYFSVDLDEFSASSVSVRATDMAGNTGTTSVRFNRGAIQTEEQPKPVIEILVPAAQMPGLHNEITVVGRIRNFSGTPELKATRKSGTPEVIPFVNDGTYWIQTVGGLGSAKETVSYSAVYSYEVTSEDGKVKTVTEKASATAAITPDKEFDIPRLTVNSPAADAVYRSEAVISAGAIDDDPIDMFVYTVDGGEEQAQRVTVNTVDLVLKNLEDGKHTVSILAVDKAGNRSKAKSVTFYISNPLLPLAVDNYSSGSNPDAAFEPGMKLNLGDKIVLKGYIDSAYPLTELTYNLNDAGPSSLKSKKSEVPNRLTFEIPLPASLPHARIPLVISGKNGYGGSALYETFFHRISPKAAEFVNDKEDIYFFDEKISGDEIRLPSGGALTGLFNGRPVTAVELDPGTDILSIRNSFNSIVLSRTGEGITEPQKVKITTVDGDESFSPAYRFIMDEQAPELVLETPVTGSWLRETVAVKGRVNERHGLKSLAFSTDGGESFANLTTEETEPGVYSFSETVQPTAADGGITFILKGTDEAGNETLVLRSFQKDTVKPVISIVHPASDEIVNGGTTITGKIADDGIVTSVEYSLDGETFRNADGIRVFSFNIDFSELDEDLIGSIALRATDKSGNVTLLNPDFSVDFEKDKPEVVIQTPPDEEIIRNDFVISGMVFDDDGINAVRYAIDDNDFTALAGKNNFTIPVAIADMTDNEHTIYIKAEDIYGIESEMVLSTFRISKEEPVSLLIAPTIEETVKETVLLQGASFDMNGILEVYVSTDNGNSFHKADLHAEESILPDLDNQLVDDFSTPKLRSEWEYRLDTSLIQDGSLPVYVKAIDKLGTEGLFTSLINIDNTVPDITLTIPFDGDTVIDEITIEGRASDNIALDAISLVLTNLEDEQITRREPVTLTTNEIFRQTLAVDDMQPGWYNLRVYGEDRSKNTTYVSRNILIEEAVRQDSMAIIFPEYGKTLHGNFTIEGRVTTTAQTDKAIVTIDDTVFGVYPLDTNGFFHLPVDPETLTDGGHVIGAKIEGPDGYLLQADPVPITYSAEGLWIVIDSHESGTYITQRPYISGRAGCYIEPVEPDSAGYADYQKKAKSLKPKRIYFSLDNGKTFETASGTTEWKFRLETQELSDGDLPMIVKAEMADGSTAVTKRIITVDETPPEIVMLGPQELGRFNDELSLFGYSSDNNDVESIEVALREGDKTSYEVPQFIQGLFIDVHALGISYAEAGLGLSFFDDNVKLQILAGKVPDGQRFVGWAFGAKLLANIAQIPFSFFLGPDWNFFSMAFNIGANFDYLTNDDEPVVIGGLMAQWEFARFTFENLAAFRSFGLYAEISLWFIPSDVEAVIIPKMAFGTRINIF